MDGVGDVALVGTTGSADFLTLRPAARQELPARQTQLGGTQGQPDAFVASLDATTRSLTYSYDGVQRLTGVTETLGTAYGYRYDLAGNRTDQYLNGLDIQRGQYDAAGELITVTTPQSTSVSGYDAAGNLTGDGANGYGYDALNRLTALTPLAAGNNPSQTYAYNGDGVLVAQTAGATSTLYTQDLAVPASQAQVLQTTRNGGTPTDYLYASDGQGATGRLASMASGTSSHTWYVADLQGSVRYSEGDNGQAANGSLTYDPQPQRYDPYGTIDRGADGTGQLPQAFGYRGELQDAATGLVNLRARMYNPSTGQFLTRDPLLQQTGQAYAYAGGDPVNQADPSGQCTINGIDVLVAGPYVPGGYYNTAPCSPAAQAYEFEGVINRADAPHTLPHDLLTVHALTQQDTNELRGQAERIPTLKSLVQQGFRAFDVQGTYPIDDNSGLDVGAGSNEPQTCSSSPNTFVASEAAVVPALDYSVAIVGSLALKSDSEIEEVLSQEVRSGEKNLTLGTLVLAGIKHTPDIYGRVRTISVPFFVLASLVSHPAPSQDDPRTAGRELKVITIGAYEVGPYNKLVRGNDEQAHHIIQNASMAQVRKKTTPGDVPGYSFYNAPNILLEGQAGDSGSQHGRATAVQLNPLDYNLIGPYK